MKDLKSFFFSNFLYYPHKNNSENTIHDERSYEMLIFFSQCIPLSPLCSIRVGRFTSSPRFGIDVFSVQFQRGS
ncbi:unnamed protein product, partial [Vitis vinifera]|uniref:Uncharacterized protein n=1 Tax=Vitis vinifera TaxID=29760 RepID=D7T1N9_VITVI